MKVYNYMKCPYYMILLAELLTLYNDKGYGLIVCTAHCS